MDGLLLGEPNGAGKEARTLDLYLGKVSLYQLSYSRMIFMENPSSRWINQNGGLGRNHILAFAGQFGSFPKKLLQ